MKPSEREDALYSAGKTTAIDQTEKILFDYMARHSPPPGLCVDLGCGSGEIGMAVVEKGYQYQGYDFSPVGIAKAQAKGLAAEVLDLDANGIPLTSESAALIFASDVIEHVFDPLYLLQESCRVLKPNGVIVASMPYDANMSALRLAAGGRSNQEAVYARFGISKHHTFISLSLIELLVTKTSGLRLLELDLIGRKSLLRRHETTVRHFTTWRVPLHIRHLSFAICIAVKKA